MSPNWIGDTLVFASDQGATFPDHADGQSNLWALDALGSGEPTQVTHHGTAEGYVRDPAGDGERIVYHARGVLYLLTGLDASPTALDVTLGGALATRRSRALAPTERLNEVRPDHGGDASVVEWRGKVFHLAHREGPARAVVADSGVRARLPRLLGRSGSAIVVSDAGGADRLEIHDLTGATAARIVDADVGRVVGLEASPAGDVAIALSRDGRVHHVDVASAQTREVAHSTEGEVASAAFSPDGRYVGVGATDSPRAVAPARRPRPVPRRRRAGDADLGPVRRHVPVVQPRRQAPAVPLGADLRSELRPALLRPVVRRRGPPLPRAAHRHRGGAVRTERRGLADQRSGRTAGGRVRARHDGGRQRRGGVGDVSGLGRRRVRGAHRGVPGAVGRLPRVARRPRRRAVDPRVGRARCARHVARRRHRRARRPVGVLLVPQAQAGGARQGRRLRAERRRPAHRRPRQGGVVGATGRPGRQARRRRPGGDRRRPVALRARPGRRVAPDVRRDGAPDDRQLLAGRHGRRRLGRGRRPLPAAARAHRLVRRSRRRAVGGDRRAQHVARLRDAAGRGR